MFNHIDQVSQDITSTLKKIETEISSSIITGEQALSADLKEVVSIYPQARPFILQSLVLLRQIPFSWVSPLVSVITILMRIADDVTNTAGTPASASQ